MAVVLERLMEGVDETQEIAGEVVPPRPKAPRVRDIDTPAGWMRRLKRIKHPDLRMWVGSILYWDINDPIFHLLVDAYDRHHTRTNNELIAALRLIGYPEPERRVTGKYKV